MSRIENIEETWNGKTYSEVEEFIKKELNSKSAKAEVTKSGNFAALDAEGNTVDSGHSPDDYLTEHQTIKTINGEPVTGSGNIVIPRGEDGADATNPFKGWFDDIGSLQAAVPEPTPGDFAYMKNATPSAPATVYRCSTPGEWEDTEIEVDTSLNQTFRTSEQVSNVGLSTDLKNGSPADVVRADAMTAVSSMIGDVGLEETRMTVMPVTGYYVDSADGDIGQSQSSSYAEFELSGSDRVRFLGIKVRTKGFSSGYAFGYYEEGVWKTVRSYGWDTNTDMQANVLKEYLVEAPAEATHFRTTCEAASSLLTPSNFYCFKQTGKSLDKKVGAVDAKIEGAVDVEDEIDAAKGGMGINQWESNLKGCFNPNGDWNTAGARTSNRIYLTDYILAGFNRIKITANQDRATAYTFTRYRPSVSKNLTAAEGEVSPLLSTLNRGVYRTVVPAGTTVYIDLPEDTDAKYMYLTRTNSDANIIYLPDEVIIQKVRKENGISAELSNVKDKINGLESGEKIIDRVEATVGRDGEFLGWEEVQGAISSNTLGNIWSVKGESKSYCISLQPYITAGFSRIKIYARESPAYYTFARKEFPTDANVGSILRFKYLSRLSTTNVRAYVTSLGVAVIDLPEDTDARYLYFTKHYASSSGDPAPYSVVFEKIEKNAGRLHEAITEQLESATNPMPPKLHNLKFENGRMVASETVLTTARIYGDFVCELNEGYKINRVFMVDVNGNIVNDSVVTEGYPAGAMDLLSAAGRKTYGVCFAPLQYGTVLEITHDDETENIHANDGVFRRFWWLDGSGLTSELETFDKYNGETPDDGNMVYTRRSVKSAIRRAKIAAMIPWRPKRYIMPSLASLRSSHYKEGDIEVGVPYSNSAPRERWFGLCVSPYTFLSAISNPYSVMYTEKIGDNDGYPMDSEYGLILSSYGSTHGIPYYGLVCSAYGSYVYGFKQALATTHFPLDTERNMIISKHGNIENSLPSAVQAEDLPPLCIITTPTHTYIVIDFLLNEEGKRVAAIVAEETSPCVKVGLYPMERLQARFDAEYTYREGLGNDYAIYVTAVKPSVLDANKDTNLWDVSNLYSIRDRSNIGVCEPSIGCDRNIMFYLGDKAVIMKYDTEHYRRNDKSWLIVKPEGIHEQIKIEKQNRDDGSWEFVETYVLNEESKQSFSDGNEDYYKVDVTESCFEAGKYRACLTDGNGEISSGYTQWIVLHGEIYLDTSDNTIRWETDNSSLNPDSDEYAVPVFAIPTIQSGQGGYIIKGERYAQEGIPWNEINSGTYPYVKVDFKCAWGTGMREVDITKLQER